ncbi:ParB/RepB/Spo0J family partition protein [Streptomyces sanglieri]|uniref:ParB/RepB/Spo0J family partition protein n=1 Tax=Streptomyces sanglieri TaxID=193460 RepID=A0ABW2WMK4_9ACTN
MCRRPAFPIRPSSLNLISQNPDNPREELRDLEGLAESIAEIGLVNAVTVASIEAYLEERPHRAADLDEGARYIVVDGHRRLAAARLAGAAKIRVSVDNALVSTDEALLEAAFVANVHRDDMNPLEQAQALRTLVDFYGSQTKAARRLGIAQSTISSKLSVLDLDPQLQADLVEGRRKIEHVRNLSKLPPDEQRQQADARAAAGVQRRSAVRELSRRDSSESGDADESGVGPIRQMVLPSRVALRDSGPQYHGVIIRKRLRQGYHGVIARGKAKPIYHGVIARARNGPTYHGVIVRELGRSSYHAVIAPRPGKKCRRRTMKYLGSGRSTPDARWLRLSWPRGSRASSRSARLRRCPGTTVIRLPTLFCGRWTRRSGRSLSTGFLPRAPTRFDEWPGGEGAEVLGY